VHEAVINADMAEADLAADAAGQDAAAGAAPPSAIASQQAASALLKPLLDALLADQHAGLLRLLQAMHSSSKVISVLMATGICIFVQAVHNRLGTSQAGAALAGAMLARQQQGLSLVLQALHDELYPDSAANVLRCLAHAAPVPLLDALLSQQQRRGMQSLLRCLDAPSEHASECTDQQSQLSQHFNRQYEKQHSNAGVRCRNVELQNTHNRQATAAVCSSSSSST
jgi:hypothetical protein